MRCSDVWASSFRWRRLLGKSRKQSSLLERPLLCCCAVCFITIQCTASINQWKIRFGRVSMYEGGSRGKKEGLKGSSDTHTHSLKCSGSRGRVESRTLSHVQVVSTVAKSSFATRFHTVTDSHEHLEGIDCENYSTALFQIPNYP
jgi:hypothetical protein